MIRLTLLWLLIAYLAVYAQKDWYKGLCGLIALMAVVEHPDFPKSILGIQGLNAWNILLVFVFIGYLASRDEHESSPGSSAGINALLALYIFFIFSSFARMILDMQGFDEWAYVRQTFPPSAASLFSERIVNCLKWMIPGLFVFVGCNTRNRFLWTVTAVCVLYVGLAIQVIKWMPFSALASGGDLTARSMKVLMNEVGYHRVNLAMILAGAFWAVFSLHVLAEGKYQKMLVYGSCGAILFALALTGGRTGYGTWAVIGFIFAVLKWRRIALLGPPLILVIALLVPSAFERLQQGFTPETMQSSPDEIAIESDGPDLYTITAGRNFAWPFILDEIAESPMFGHGGHATVRTGIATTLLVNYSESFPHPHNMYLEWTLDNGIVALVPVLLFFAVVVTRSKRMLLAKNELEVEAVGGMALALVMAFLIAGIGSQTFYPREGSVGMWVAIGLMLRMYNSWQKN